MLRVVRYAALTAVLALVGCGRKNFDSEVDADTTADANIVFVTSTTYVPSTFGGLEAADAACMERAAAAGLDGQFIAWLSTTTVKARDRLSGSRGWVRVDGKPVTDTVDGLLQGKMFHTLRIDESGNDVGNAGARVATGTSANGDQSDNCDDYTDSALEIQNGAPEEAWPDFTSNNKDPCTAPLRLYCFGIGKNVTIEPVAPAEHRIAFISSGLFAPGGGIAAADALCASEGSLAGLEGTFKALLGSTTATAASRFSLEGPPWVRVDGIQLAATNLDLMANVLIDAPLTATATGQYIAESVWTGGGSALEIREAGDTCNDWTDPAAVGDRGYSAATDLDFFDDSSSIACSQDRLYCLQE